jgi:hypothetical protein
MATILPVFLETTALTGVGSVGMPICEAMYAMSCFSASDAVLPIERIKLTPRAAPAVAAMPRKMSRRSRLIFGGEERGGGGGGGGGGGRLG